VPSVAGMIVIKFHTRWRGVFFPDLHSAVQMVGAVLRKVCGRALLLMASLLFVSPADFAAEPQVLVLNDVNEPPLTTPEHTGFLDMIATEMFRRIEVELRLVKLPAERALLLANDGLEDGDLTRIAGLEEQYPNLVRVPEKLIDWDFAAFSKDASIPVNFEAIRRHSVGLIRGWKIYERNMAGAEHVTTVDDPQQLFRLLDRDRIEVALYTRWMGLALIQKQGLKDIRPLEPPLVSRAMYIYLNKRHAKLVPKLAEALRALKREGYYQRVYREKLLPYNKVNGW
jgi:polar amino acid transport system substrate-binding protein